MQRGMTICHEMKYPMPQNGFGRPACIIVQFIKVSWALAGTSFNELDSCNVTADNATYFGVFSDPDGASGVSPQRALDDLGAVAKMVREATGVKVRKLHT